MNDEKKQLRAHFKQLRAAIPQSERSAIDSAIAQQVCALDAFAQADLVLPYLSFGAEVETRTIIQTAWQKGKTVALPRCVPGTRYMKWYRQDSFEGLVTSNLGVEEPAEDPAREINPADFEHALCLVPGLTFDKQGYRLGYGGGFYDTFLATFHGVSVGLCRTCQLSEKVAFLDAHDLPVDCVISEAGQET